MSWAAANVAIAAKAAEQALAGTGLGLPSTAVTPIAGTEGYRQQFAVGTVYWSLLYGACVVGNDLDARYQELGGPAGFLGFPIADQEGAGAGRYVRLEFQGSLLAAHPDHGIHAVYGLIGEHYWKILGGPAGVWGYPRTDEYPDGDGRACDFQGGTLFWTAADGILEIYAETPPAPPSVGTFTDAERQAVQQRWAQAGGYQPAQTGEHRRRRAYQLWREKADAAIAAARGVGHTAQATAWQAWVETDERRQVWELLRQGPEPPAAEPQPAGLGEPVPRPGFRNVFHYDVTLPGGAAYRFTDNLQPTGRYFRHDTGVAIAGQKLTTVADLDQLLHAAGTTDPGEVKAMKAVSAHEGGFEAVNTYDTGHVSVGFIQFITGADGRGPLAGLLRRLKAADPAQFASYFRDLGVDVTSNGLVVVDPGTGTLRLGADAVQAIIDDKRLTAVFHHAGRHSRSFRVAQLRHAREQYWLAPRTFRVAVTVGAEQVAIEGRYEQVLRSEAGRTALLDRAVQHGQGGAQQTFRHAAEQFVRQRHVRTLDQLAAHERRIIEQVQNRHHVLADPQLSQPPTPPD